LDKKINFISFDKRVREKYVISASKTYIVALAEEEKDIYLFTK